MQLRNADDIGIATLHRLVVAFRLIAGWRISVPRSRGRKRARTAGAGDRRNAGPDEWVCGMNGYARLRCHRLCSSIPLPQRQQQSTLHTHSLHVIDRHQTATTDAAEESRWLHGAASAASTGARNAVFEAVEKLKMQVEIKEYEKELCANQKLGSFLKNCLYFRFLCNLHNRLDRY